MEKINSKDGTTIGFDQLGQGPAMVLVAGAACDRTANAPVAEALARYFTVLNYDRRGRGDSTDTPPYADRLAGLLAADRRGDALAHFLTYVGIPAEAIAGTRRSPYWPVGLRLAPTLAYDAAIPGARHEVLAGQDHNVAGGGIAPVVAAFAGR